MLLLSSLSPFDSFFAITSATITVVANYMKSIRWVIWHNTIYVALEINEERSAHFFEKTQYMHLIYLRLCSKIYAHVSIGLPFWQRHKTSLSNVGCRRRRCTAVKLFCREEYFLSNEVKINAWIILILEILAFDILKQFWKSSFFENLTLIKGSVIGEFFIKFKLFLDFYENRPYFK